MRLLILISFILGVGNAEARHKYPERYYQENLCYGATEVRLPDRTRVDCLTRDYAVEFEFAPKWAEAVGQSLHYAAMTGRRPAIYLIVENEKQWRYADVLRDMCPALGISLWVFKGY